MIKINILIFKIVYLLLNENNEDEYPPTPLYYPYTPLPVTLDAGGQPLHRQLRCPAGR